MHIPDGVLDPRVAAATSVLGGLGLAYAVHRLNRTRTERTPILMGTTAAFLFAAQMVNFPVGPGVSGHLLGGVLASTLLGPWAGAVVIFAVLLVQCFLFGDGGLTALGANFINMGLIGSTGGYAIASSLRTALKGPRGALLAAMLAAWVSVILASGAFAIELAAAGSGQAFLPLLAWMTLVHAAIGLGEAIITGLVVRALILRRPALAAELAANSPTGLDHQGGVPIVAILSIALAVAIFLAPFASSWPDGLEFVGDKLGFLSEQTEPPPIINAPMPDYQVPWLGLNQVRLVTAIAGLIGTLSVFTVGFVLSRALPRSTQHETAPHAA